LTIRGVLTPEGVAHIAPAMLEKGLSDDTIAVLKSMMNPTIVSFLGATGGDLRKIIIEKLTPQVTAALQKGVDEVEVYTQTRSILSAVRRLYEVGSPVPATLILLFSVIVPFGKAALVAGRRSPRMPLDARPLSSSDAKWSMADVRRRIFIAYSPRRPAPPGRPPLVAFTAHFGPVYWFAAYCLFSLPSSPRREWRPAPSFRLPARREARALEGWKLEAGAGSSKLEASDIRDTVDLDEGVAGDPAGGGDRRTHAGLGAEAAEKYLVHAGIVFQVVQVDVDLQHLLHRRTGPLEVLLDLVERASWALVKCAPIPETNTRLP
jgi:hypothetical protein